MKWVENIYFAVVDGHTKEMSQEGITSEIRLLQDFAYLGLDRNQT